MPLPLVGPALTLILHLESPGSQTGRSTLIVPAWMEEMLPGRKETLVLYPWMPEMEPKGPPPVCMKLVSVSNKVGHQS